MTEDGAELPRYFTSFVQEMVASEEHEVTIEPADEYGWLICVDGDRVLPGLSQHGMPWENFTLGSDWQRKLTSEQKKRIQDLHKEVIDGAD